MELKRIKRECDDIISTDKNLSVKLNFSEWCLVGGETLFPRVGTRERHDSRIDADRILKLSARNYSTVYMMKLYDSRQWFLKLKKTLFNTLSPLKGR